MATLIGTCPYTFKQDQYSSHAQIARCLRRHAEAAQTYPYRVLDVGCASGFLRPLLPSPSFHLIGLDYNADLVAKAQLHYDEVYQADLNQDLSSLPLQSLPHCIVLADILEHLPQPELVLTQVLNHWAKPGTPIIISLPNVAHLYIRLNLLLGRFPYSDRGILDRTHLRFFTLRTAHQLCISSGIRLSSIRATPIPLPLVHSMFRAGQPLFMIHALSAFLANLFKGLLAYQFILHGAYEP